MRRTPLQLDFETTPKLVTADKYLKHSGFPPGTTVDQLFLYRKKPPDVIINDNLQLERGSFQSIISEYKRRFRKDLLPIQTSKAVKGRRPRDTLKVGDDLYFNPEYYDSHVEDPVETSTSRLLGTPMEVKDESENSEDEELNKHIRLGRHLFGRPNQLKLEGDILNVTESAEKFVQYLLTEKTKLMRRPTTLKMEGDMEIKTESSGKYVAYENQIRPNLLKTDTTLHLEGDIGISTENRDKFLPLELLPRPPLAKRNTNLHMEGDMYFLSENRDQFLPLELLPRPPLTKRGTNLHLEGDMSLNSEYRNIFVDFEEPERVRTAFPTNNLKCDGFLQTVTETSKFVKHDIQPVIPLLRNYDDVDKRIHLGDDRTVKKAEYKSKFIQHPKVERSAQRPKENVKIEGTLDVATENEAQLVAKPPSKSALKKVGTNLQLEGKLDLNPEYKNAYVNFYKDAYGKFGLVKDAGSHRRRRPHLKSEGDMETNPEYKSAFVDFSRQRPSTRKPDGHMHTEGNISNMTEKRAQFIEHPPSKPHLMKRPTELKLAGPFECYPEYRRAYIDYVTRNNAAERQPRFPENLNAQRRRIFGESIEGPPAAPAETT